MKNALLHLKSRLYFLYVTKLAPVRVYKRKTEQITPQAERKIGKVINDFVSRELSSEEIDFLSRDMKEKAVRYGFSFKEYFLLHLQGKPEAQIREYISDYEHVDIASAMNKAKNQAIFDDKWLTYRFFGKYYHRACAFAESSFRGVECLRAFAEKYGDFILKPVEKAGGRGICIVHSRNTDELQESISMLLKKCKYGVLIEELIQQVPVMKELHPASVNTVRIPTIRVSDKKTMIFHPMLRVGREASIVDNAGSGGIICVLDSESGKVIAARDEQGNEFITHPETGVRLIGFTVPQWEEAVRTAKELAQVIPSNRYTGWDLALTDKGWVMVEGNARGQFGWQYVTLEGCRSEISQLFNEMGIEYNGI